MNIQSAITTLAELAAASKAQAFDIVGYDSFSESVEVFEQKISNTEIQSSAALGVRVFCDHRPGIAFTERLTPEALKICLSDAISHTQLTGAVEYSVAEPQPASEKKFDHLSPDFERVALSDLADFSRRLESETRARDARIENVPYTGAGRSSATSYFMNSKGITYEQTHQEFSAYTAAVAAAGDQKKMGFYSNSRPSFSELLPLDFAGIAARRTLEQLGAAPVKSGEYTVLFSNRVAGQILSIYQSSFFADAAQRGQSRLKGRLGERIASPLLTITSAAHDLKLKGSRARDAEGTPTRDIAVVEAGVFTNFLYNLESAGKDKRVSTGNAVRSIGSKASTGFKNLVVSPGNEPAPALLSGRVLLIDKLEGAAGCSAVSGEMSIGAQGFLYEGGVRVQPVDRITLSANIFDMLQNIEAISNEYNDQYGSVCVPDLLIGKISVAG
ncbi:TldD/PmbA family protein [Turneriella parva]|uniref:Peptidase U62 modulator of DNA gyrase n=1 Tax=Turneriella parva (strain ATCC BAA-1111 / DSM 21527 / NCTC 11395 / H) TaxID=869212 RepID=I4BAP5_TURPD|nr:metallopeptidase TldD-related protein [Turneriella parva]AFM14352.1 peptidase U62 modulator of DNA gyrase [Turneriella parva DSM 21527]